MYLRSFAACLLAVGVLQFSSRLWAQEAPPPPPDDTSKELQPGVTLVPRGPVHEAFAQPSNNRPEASAAVPNKPPAPIPEEPPDQKPKGKDVTWIPGYWAWDLEKKDFIWVSGVWRAAPPGRKWVPGYWHEADAGWQWVSGMWQPLRQEEMRYTDRPPESLDNGPNQPAPGNDSIYVPGTWVWREGAWVWRPGFWNDAHANWIWHPGCYYWTPNGWVFSEGYWDYPLEDRGLLFAPVCFDSPLWLTPGWCYRPGCCVNLGSLCDCLFFGPGCGCYWFGNCYGPFWRVCGFRPWCGWGGRCWDPLFCHQRWVNRFNNGWAGGLRSNFHNRFNGVSPRPAVTAGGRTVAISSANSQVAGQKLVTPLSQANTRGGLARLDSAQHVEQHNTGLQLQQAARARGNAEGAALRNGGQGANTVRLPSQVNVARAEPRIVNGNGQTNQNTLNSPRTLSPNSNAQTVRPNGPNPTGRTPGQSPGARYGSAPSYRAPSMAGRGGGFSRGGGGGGRGGRR